MVNERKTDLFISRLLDKANIKYCPNGSDIVEIDKALKSCSKSKTGKAGYPEFIGCSKNFIIVIEDKSDVDKQALYTDSEKTILSENIKAIKEYAENGALHYAKNIIKKTNFKKVFAFGCSGDEKHHTIKPIYVDETKYEILQEVENFENFSIENIDQYYSEIVLKETPVETLELEEILKKAGELHELLRNYGQLGENEKPLVVSAILLALSDSDFRIETLTGDKINTDGKKIFNALSNYMDRVEVTPNTKKDKVLAQFNIVKDRTILNQIDDRLTDKSNKEKHLKKTPLRFFAEYLKNNILATVKANTTEDVLGRFYGEFIRFSGGEGQTLGVVLTPAHITELFCDLIDLKPTDRVFDPCCGTGGFLVTAMHKMIEKASSKQINHIKKEQLHGIEIREDMFSIATTNMILRGDGKSNLENVDFLKQSAEEIRNKNISVGFINPPYSQSKNKDTHHLSEIHFIKHLLDGLADGGRCVVIVPQSTMIGKNKADVKIKKQILKSHTLEGVITLNKNTFYGVGTNPCIAIFTAHSPHDKNKYCKFINFEDDGYIVSKHIGLTKTQHAVTKKQQLLDCWCNDAPAESKFMVKSTIEAEDEWLHSFYYFNDEIPTEKDFEKTLSDYLTFEFDMIAQGKKYLFEENNDEIFK